MRIKSAFSIAEMLVVVAALSLVIAAMAPFVIKKNVPKIIKQERGRYECWWDGNTLKQRYTVRGVVGDDQDVTRTGCEFNPLMAKDSDFLAINAIGGGGGGSYAPMPSMYTDPDGGNLTVVKEDGSGGLSLPPDSPQWMIDETSTTGKTFSMDVKGNGGDGGSGWGSSVNFIYKDVNLYPGCQALCQSSCAKNPYWSISESTGGRGGNGGGTTVTVTLKLGDTMVCNDTGLGYELRAGSTRLAYCTHGTPGTSAPKDTYSPPTIRDGTNGTDGSCNGSGSGRGGAGGGGGKGKMWTGDYCSMLIDSNQQHIPRSGASGTGGGCTRSGTSSTPELKVPWSQELKYKRLTEGKGGSSGETNTTYLMRPYPEKCIATIGKGGAKGTGTSTSAGATAVNAAAFGSPTEVTCSNASSTTLTLKANGGTGGNEYTVLPLLMDGMANKETSKPGGAGGASNYVANEKLSEDKIINFGYGGTGGGSTINTKSALQKRTYDGANKDTPVDSSKNTGNDTITAPEDGKTGAFVVIW